MTMKTERVIAEARLVITANDDMLWSDPCFDTEIRLSVKDECNECHRVVQLPTECGIPLMILDHIFEEMKQTLIEAQTKINKEKRQSSKLVWERLGKEYF